MFFLNNKKLKKSFEIVLVMMIFFAINIVTFSEKSEFLAIGNLKIVRQEPLVIKREDLNITIEKNKTIKVESVYTFENVGNYNVKSTFMFWLDTNIEKSLKEDFSNKNTNNRGKFVKNIKFLTDYKKAQNLRKIFMKVKLQIVSSVNGLPFQRLFRRWKKGKSLFIMI